MLILLSALEKVKGTPGCRTRNVNRPLTLSRRKDESARVAQWQRSRFVIGRLAVRLRSRAEPNDGANGGVGEWLKPADCKSAAERLRRFESCPRHFSETRLDSSPTLLNPPKRRKFQQNQRQHRPDIFSLAVDKPIGCDVISGHDRTQPSDSLK